MSLYEAKLPSLREKLAGEAEKIKVEKVEKVEKTEKVTKKAIKGRRLNK